MKYIIILLITVLSINVSANCQMNLTADQVGPQKLGKNELDCLKLKGYEVKFVDNIFQTGNSLRLINEWCSTNWGFKSCGPAVQLGKYSAKDRGIFYSFPYQQNTLSLAVKALPECKGLDSRQ